jgi:aspartate carbamoyltransferase catalytic subunit
MIKNVLFHRDIVSIKDIELSEIKLIFDTAKKMQQGAAGKTLANKIIANCFFESSTRTRLSFETAALKLGGNVIGFSSDESLSIQKGENLHDTIRVMSEYADLIIIRHPREGSAVLAAEVASCPVINAGDGANQHPTQALVDLFSIQECQQEINGLSIALVGDLKYGRAIHSLTEACSLFDVRLYLVSPLSLSLPDTMCDILKKRGIRFSFHQTIEEIISKVDILYTTRIQLERFDAAQYALIKDQYIVIPAMLTLAKPNLKIMHPLPRVNEITLAVDKTPFAYYFQQAGNAVPVRQALLTLLLNESLP